MFNLLDGAGGETMAIYVIYLLFKYEMRQI
jgi:hypothetical protein